MQLPGTPALSRIRPRCERSVDHRLRQLGRGLFRRGIVDELDGEHRSEPAHVADLRVALLPREHPVSDRGTHHAGPLDDSLLLEHVEHGERRGESDRVADERAADRAAGERSP